MTVLPFHASIQGKFLYAHKHLMDLENSRDELLYEIHRQPQQSPTSLLTVNTYFKGVAPLNIALEKKVKWGRGQKGWGHKGWGYHG